MAKLKYKVGDEWKSISPSQEEFDELKEEYTQNKEDTQIKIGKIEKELTDYKSTMQQVNINQESTQSVSGYSILSLPSNATNGQVSGVEVNGQTATNLVKNGSFENDSNNDGFADYWLTTAGSELTMEIVTDSVYGNRAQKLTTDGSVGSRYIYQKLKLYENHKYYVSAYVKKTQGSDAGLIALSGSGLTSQMFTFEFSNVFTKYSNVFIIPEGQTSEEWRLGLYANRNSTGETEEVIWDGVMLIDITETFGEGNEPTVEECDVMFPTYFEGTKSTVSAIRLKSVGKNLFDTKSKYELIGRGVDKAEVNVVDNSIEFRKLYGNHDDIHRAVSYDLRLEPNTSYSLRYNVISRSFSGNRLTVLKKDTGEYLGKPTSTIGDNSFSFTTDNYGAYSLVALGGRQVSDSILVSNIQLEKNETITPYEPYTESTQYIQAKDSEGKIVELRSLPNGTKDEIRVSGGKAELVKRVSDDILLPTSGWQYRGKSTNGNFHIISCNNVAIDSFSVSSDNLLPTSAMSFSDKSFATYTCAFTYLQNNVSQKTIGKFHRGNIIYLAIPIAEYSQAETNVGADAYVLANLAGTTLTYQLAEPEIIPIEVSGNLITYPSGTIYVEKVVPDAGVYGENGITIQQTDLPIKEIDKLIKYDFETGVQTVLDVSEAVISDDGLSFTHPDLEEGDMVFFDYYYDVESTEGEVEVEYYDSRYIVEDSVTGKFYKWSISVENGVPSVQLEEV